MISVGDRATLVFDVTEADTAAQLGSGDVAVLGTPRLLAWLEAATIAAVAGRLPADETTVGARVELAHLAPSPVGAAVSVTAQVSEVTGRRVTFRVSAANPDGQLVGEGEILRVRAPRDRFA